MNGPGGAPHRNGVFSHGVTVEEASARLCEACGAVLAGRSSRNRRFCSAACRQEAYRGRKEKRAAEKYAGVLR